MTPKLDDWSGLKPVAAPAPASKSIVMPQAATVANGVATPDDDPANSGLRREPGLERHKDIALERVKTPTNEFDPDAEEPKREVVVNRALARDMRLMARRIALDPGDGMEL
jgi:type IV secretion system protein VirD4